MKIRLLKSSNNTTNSAFGFCLVSQWKRESDVRLENYVNSTAVVGRALDCMVLCQEAIFRCDSYNHRPIDNACELNSNSAGFDQSAKVSSPSWNWWTTYY